VYHLILMDIRLTLLSSQMFSETTPRKSSKWVPHQTFAQQHDMNDKVESEKREMVAEHQHVDR